MTLKSKYMSPREGKGKRGGSAIPPEVVHPIEDRARDALLILRSIRLSLAIILQGAPVPSGIGLRLDITIDMEEGRLRLYAYRVCLIGCYCIHARVHMRATLAGLGMGMTLAGLKPATFASEERRLIH